MRDTAHRFPPGWPIFAGFAGLLAWAAWRNAGALNADAIAYLRLAGYYAEGRLDLAVSGYWGPLLSWLIAPLLKLGLPPLAAGRLVMALSTLLFLAGVWAVLRRFAMAAQESGRADDTTPTWAKLGLLIAGAGAVSWSVEYISPDLLQGGLWLLGMSVVMDAPWRCEPRRAALAGAWLGAAYLAKSVALPMSVAAVVGLWVWQSFRHRTASGAGNEDARKPGQPAADNDAPGSVAAAPAPWRSWISPAVTLAVMLVIAAPWILVLSSKYGRFTFSTSAPIAHAMVGPEPAERSHPFGRMFHRPAPGRITAWEDPSEMPYRYWSPFESSAAFWHQLAVCREHARTVLELLRSFDWLMLGPIACLYGTVLLVRRGRQALGEWWLVAALPLAALCAVYLPVYLQPVDQRYLYAAWPLSFVLAAGCLVGVARRNKDSSLLHSLLRWLPLASFGLPAMISLAGALVGYANPAAEAAAVLARRLQQAELTGPLAGSGMLYGGRTGLYVAYLTGQPWLGDEPRADAERYAASGARLIVVPRRHPVAALLAASPRFTDLDARLFTDRAEAEGFPLRVFERAPADPPTP